MSASVMSYRQTQEGLLGHKRRDAHVDDPQSLNSLDSAILVHTCIDVVCLAHLDGAAHVPHTQSVVFNELLAFMGLY